MDADEAKELQEKLKQQEEEAKELREKVEKLEEKLTKANGRVDNAQTKIHEWEEEVGESRKAAADGAQQALKLSQELTEANGNKAEIELELAKLRAKLEQKDEPTGSEGKEEHSEKSVTDLVDSLTEEEQKLLDEKWEEAEEELRKELKADPAKMKRFILLAKGAVAEASASDLSTWRSTPAQSKENSKPLDGDALERLFKSKKQRDEYVPDGPSANPRSPSRRVGAQPNVAKKSTYFQPG